ncbi:hypothetical protein BJ741DRAFT_595154 [Chytriomyces cf. hyalinus JEL632]|nr:hypothetical protein BJ741DRAFT_595154 [Chytriomyces cf. hyalinus JEL632]
MMSQATVMTIIVALSASVLAQQTVGGIGDKCGGFENAPTCAEGLFCGQERNGVANFAGTCQLAVKGQAGFPTDSSAVSMPASTSSGVTELAASTTTGGASAAKSAMSLTTTAGQGAGSVTGKGTASMATATGSVPLGAKSGGSQNSVFVSGALIATLALLF